MALALKSPELVEDIVSVDNAPIDAALLSNFGKYIQGMKRIEEAGVTRQAEADNILKEYEKVILRSSHHAFYVTDLTGTAHSTIPPRKPLPHRRQDAEVQGPAQNIRVRARQSW